MPIEPHNLVRHELIGLKVKVKKSTNKSQIGLQGIVVDETYNTIRIESNRKEKAVAKNTAIFIFTLPNGKRVEVNGKLLASRPEDRIKKKFPRW